MKITTGRQLLEWLQKQPDSVLDDKVTVCGEDIPTYMSPSISILKQDVYDDGDCTMQESDMMDGYGTREEMLKECVKVYDKGGIMIYL
jgi:hypothetical protein